METAADFLTEEETRAIETAESGDAEACRALAEESDQDSWISMFLYGCADMIEGHHTDALARWMVAADMMEDVRDMAVVADAMAKSVARGIIHWDFPAHLELSVLTALSHGMSPLMGFSDSQFLCVVLEYLRGLVSRDNQAINAAIMQAASAVAYMVMMFGKDIREMREAAGSLLGVMDQCLDSMDAAGFVPPELDSLPIDQLREHTETHVLPYEVFVREYDAASRRFSEDELSDIIGYWSGSRGDRLLDKMADIMDIGVRYMDTDDPKQADACSKAVRMYVLKYLRIRK